MEYLQKIFIELNRIGLAFNKNVKIKLDIMQDKLQYNFTFSRDYEHILEFDKNGNYSLKIIDHICDDKNSATERQAIHILETLTVI